MEYVFTKSYTGKAICGDIKIHKGTKAQTQGQLLLIGNKPIAVTHSDFAYTYTARNDDGRGKERGALIQEIRYQKALRFNPIELTKNNFPEKGRLTYIPHQVPAPVGTVDVAFGRLLKRLCKLGYISWDEYGYGIKDFIAYFGNDGFMAKFRRPEHESVWLWNHDFYNAEISDLEKILTKIKGV